MEKLKHIIFYFIFKEGKELAFMEPCEVAPIYQIQIYIQHTDARILKPQTLISSKAKKRRKKP